MNIPTNALEHDMRGCTLTLKTKHVEAHVVLEKSVFPLPMPSNPPQVMTAKAAKV